MKNFKEIILLNSSTQNETIAWYCLEHSEIERFKQLLADEMPLTVFMLTAMVFFDYSDDRIKDILKLAKKYEQDVLKWMRSYFPVDELAEVLPNYQDQLPADWPNNEDCVRFKLWETLRKRRQNLLIAQNAPEVAEEMRLYSDLVQIDFAKYAPICLKNGWFGPILAGQEGWKYLIDNGQADFVLAKGDLSGLLPRKEIVDYCLQKGLFDELFKAKCYDELLAHDALDVFVNNHSFYGKFLTGHPDKVKWEELWECCSNDISRECLIEQAWKNKKEPACYEFLMSHTGLFKQILLFV